MENIIMAMDKLEFELSRDNIDSAVFASLFADEYAEYRMLVKMLGAKLAKYGLHLLYEDWQWRLLHIGITEGQVGAKLGDYHGTAQEILTIALDLYVKVANESA